MSNITVIMPVEAELLADFSEYCKDHNVTLVEGLTNLIKKATGHKVKRVKLNVPKKVTG